jgi:hypothetical protein
VRGVPPSRREAAAGKGPIGAHRTASTTQVFRWSLRPAPDKSSDLPAEEWTSLQPPSSRRRKRHGSPHGTTDREEGHHVGGSARVVPGALRGPEP